MKSKWVPTSNKVPRNLPTKIYENSANIDIYSYIYYNRFQIMSFCVNSNASIVLTIMFLVSGDSNKTQSVTPRDLINFFYKIWGPNVGTIIAILARWYRVKIVIIVPVNMQSKIDITELRAVMSFNYKSAPRIKHKPNLIWQCGRKNMFAGSVY